LKKFLPILLVLASACSLRPLAVRSTAEVIKGGVGALYDESDPAFAKDAFPSQLKLLEELLYDSPRNASLLVLAAQGFAGYSFLFIEDSNPARAQGFYRRGRNYALRALADCGKFKNIKTESLAALSKELKGASRKDVPALFWAAFNWAGEINLKKDSPENLAALPKVAAIMRRVKEINPGYSFAGPELFFGTYNSRPPMLGGNPKKAKAYFERAQTLDHGEYLMAYVLEAQSYAVAVQDRSLFESLLKKVKDLPAGQLPNARLSDEVAKEKAARLLEKENELF
jgi:hypothetical protein